ncbi:gp53-like domain-containing protein [Escherichia coli]
MMPVSRYLCIFINVGLGDLVTAGTASGVLSSNGYVTIPLMISGVKRTLIIQWGQGSFGGSGSETAGVLNSFPFAFPSACWGMVVSHNGNYPAGAGVLSTSAITPTQFRGFSSVATTTSTVYGRYIALGV